MKSMIISVATIVIVSGISGASLTAQTLLWDNGSYITGIGCEGYDASTVESPGHVFGARFDHGSYGQADDFTIPESEVWTLSHMVLHAFQRNAPENAPFEFAYVELYDHAPERGSVPIAGDMTTDRLIEATFAQSYRDFGAAECDRAVKEVEVDLSWLPPLESGVYFLHVQAVGFKSYNGPWLVPKTPRGAENNPIGAPDNSRYFSVSTGRWTENNDEGWPMDFPFKLFGEREGGKGGGEPALTITGVCPGELALEAMNMTPTGSVAFVYAFGEGSVVVPKGRPCAGVALGLDRTATLADTARADAQGAARITPNAPQAACGRALVQALDVESCRTTNVVAVP